MTRHAANGRFLRNRNQTKRMFLYNGGDMAVRVIKTEPDQSVVKRVVCKLCGATLEYVPLDVKERHGTDIGGGPDGCKWIDCPQCKREVILESW